MERVQLELRPLDMGRDFGTFQLAFVAVDPQAASDKADFIDIHYRINNEDSVNLRVLTEAAITNSNEVAKHASVDGIQLEEGDIIRAYATYSANGIACDTAIHTFNAPDMKEMKMMLGGVSRPSSRSAPQWQSSAQSARGSRRSMPRMSAEDEFWTAAAIDAERNAAVGACPAIAFDQDVLKMVGQRDSFVLSFENKTPLKQLHYVDLHISTDGQAWDNLRLASDMQLDLAHKVMQPGVTIKPNEQLSFYWSYRTAAADGSIVDCTSPITTVTAADITHEVDLNQLKH